MRLSPLVLTADSVNKTSSRVQRDGAQIERERLVSRAIRGRKRRGAPLTPEAVAKSAIAIAECGTSYAQFTRSLFPNAWVGIWSTFLAEAERQLVRGGWR